jgi:hypothetical protein
LALPVGAGLQQKQPFRFRFISAAAERKSWRSRGGPSGRSPGLAVVVAEGGSRAAIAALSDMVRMTGNDDTGEAGDAA